MKYLILIFGLLILTSCNKYSYIGEYRGHYILLNNYNGDILYKEKYLALYPEELKRYYSRIESDKNENELLNKNEVSKYLEFEEEKNINESEIITLKLESRYYNNQLLYKIKIDLQGLLLLDMINIYLRDDRYFILEEINISNILNNTKWYGLISVPSHTIIPIPKEYNIPYERHEQDKYFANILGSIPITMENFNELKKMDFDFKRK